MCHLLFTLFRALEMSPRPLSLSVSYTVKSFARTFLQLGFKTTHFPCWRFLFFSPFPGQMAALLRTVLKRTEAWKRTVPFRSFLKSALELRRGHQIHPWLCGNGRERKNNLLYRIVHRFAYVQQGIENDRILGGFLLVPRKEAHTISKTWEWETSVLKAKWKR